jgi:osmotically-inducible protein OsmY
MGGFADAIDDATITTAVKSKLLWSRYTEGLKTTVVTKSGRVSLTGTAESAAAKELAGRLAMNTRGVVSVNNALVVSQDKGPSPVASTERVISDSWITTKVKSTLLYSSNVSGMDVEVKTQSGVVTLTGVLGTGAEKALAVELAENVHGVKRVEAGGLTFSQ